MLLSACASGGDFHSPYARTPAINQIAAATPQEIIEQELEPGEIRKFRGLLDDLAPEERRALLSVVSQIDEGRRGEAVAFYIIENRRTAKKFARIVGQLGPHFETGLAQQLSTEHFQRWSGLQRALHGDIDEQVLVRTIRLYALGGHCYFDQEELDEMNRVVFEGRIQLEGGFIGEICDESVQTLDHDWNYTVPRMIMALRAPEGSAPYQVQLMRAGKDREYYHQAKRSRYEMQAYGRKLDDFERDHVCGAVYIGSDFALTAAHCLEGWKGYDSEFFAARRVRAGTLDIGEDSGAPGSTGEVIRIKSVVIHANYVEGKAYAGYDIALLKLGSVPKGPATSRANVPPYPRNRLASGSTLVQTGWGLTGATSNSQLARDLKGNLQASARYLRFGEMQLYDNSRCDNNPAFKDKKVKTRYGQICVGSEEGVDACKGDSGGPLVQKRNGQLPVLIGIVSWGIGCGMEGRPALYTDVGTFYTWILLAKSAARDGRIVYTK